MTAVSDVPLAQLDASPVWRLDWLTPTRCRLIFAAMLLLIAIGNLLYLHLNCPIDLSGDEAQYWDWSRRLDLSYYSKGPLVAYIIRASCSIFGDTMQAVRYPAIVFGAATSLVMYLLTSRLFGSERLALGSAILLNLMPIFIVGGVFMTIDPPMFFCWALSTYFAAVAIFEERRWMWVLAGVAIGIGFLAKYSAFLWFIGPVVFCLSSRRKLAPVLMAIAIAALFTAPVLMWNVRNDWVSLRHVAGQTGASKGGFSAANIFGFLGGQVAAAGALCLLMGGAIVYALRRDDPQRAKLIFLMWIGLPFFCLNLLVSFRAKTQVNWPAPTYFSLTILAAYFIATRLRTSETWEPWRGWVWATVIVGLVAIPIARYSELIVPAIRVDPLARVKGWAQLGEHVSENLKTLGSNPIVICDDYQQTAETAFYVEGQPKTYCAGFYFGKRMTQYDVWPDRRLDAPELLGRNAVYVGKGGGVPDAVVAAFERVEPVPELPIVVGGVTVKTFKTWRTYGFKGMTRPVAGKDF